jgi:hypothetical protein
MLLQKPESVQALPFNKLPDCESDVVIHFLMTELTDDSATHPEEATELILFKRPDQFLGHWTQQRKTVYTIRIDDIFEIFSHRLRYELGGTKDGESIA